MTASSSRWKDQQPPDNAWRCPPGLSRAQRSAEQDRATGGREKRLVNLGDGRFSRASIELKVYSKTRRIRAYLRWTDKGRYPTKYVGEVDGHTRMHNLEAAWQLALKRKLLPGTHVAQQPWASTPAVRSVMRGNRARDTRPELALRAALRAHGLGYRVDTRPVPDIRRRADVVFVRPRVAVFCDGCYWHGCPDHYRPSRKNEEFWTAKIAGNQDRDRETDRLLSEAGWHVIRVWEHEDPNVAAGRIAQVVKKRRSAGLRS